jgi:Protein of unknown function (DUF2499)
VKATAGAAKRLCSGRARCGLMAHVQLLRSHSAAAGARRSSACECLQRERASSAAHALQLHAQCVTHVLCHCRVTAVWLMWTFAEATERPYWKGMSWAMVPSLGAAMCACTWHWFYNAPELEVRLIWAQMHCLWHRNSNYERVLVEVRLQMALLMKPCNTTRLVQLTCTCAVARGTASRAHVRRQRHAVVGRLPRL